MGVRTVSFSVPGGRAASRVARLSVLSVEPGLPHDQRHQIALLLSELVTNAVQHGGAAPDRDVEVRLSATSERVRVEVEDPGADGGPSAERLTPEGGWGLVLVDHLADQWGLTDQPSGGSLAWFELALDAQAA